MNFLECRHARAPRMSKGAELTALTVADTIHGIAKVYASDDIKQKLTKQAKATMEKAKQAAKAVVELKSLVEASDTPAETIIELRKAGQQPRRHGQPGQEGHRSVRTR